MTRKQSMMELDQNMNHAKKSIGKNLIILLVATLMTGMFPASRSFSQIQEGPPSYIVYPAFDLAITPPPDAHFEIPLWVVPGGMRQITISTSYSYKCFTPLNPLADTILLSSEQCILATRDYVHKGNSDAREWGRNYNGIFTQHPITFAGSERLIALGGAENKNENILGNCGHGGTCYQSTINTDVPCNSCASEYCNNIYTECWSAYSGLINMSWQYYDESHAWGMMPHNETGPIIWPSNGYTYGGQKSSEGARHPHGVVAQDYIWMFYLDNSYGSPSSNRGPGIKVARAPLSSGGLPGNWQSLCDGAWVDSLPPGFDVNNITEFYPQQGGCATPVIYTGGFHDKFAVAKTTQGGYLAIEENHTEDVWTLRLWESND